MLAAVALLATACSAEVSDTDLDDVETQGDQGGERGTDDATTATSSSGEFVFATSVAAPSLHPYNETSDARMRRSPLIYDTLVEWDENLEPAPGLAESWDIEDDAWTFHLREATFHDGSPVTADDVIYSLEQVLDSPGAGFYGAIQGMSAEDDRTVRVDVSDAAGPLLMALGGRYAYIVPEGAAEDYDLNNEAVGSGVYELVEFNQGQSMVLQRHDDHWRADEVGAEKLTIQVVDDESSIVAGLRSGTIHAALFEDVRAAQLLENDDDINITRDPATRWDVLDFPLDTEPFSDVKFRQAIASALDRDAIMELAIGGLGTRLGGHPPALGGALEPEEAEFAQRDLERAEELLDESSYDGEPLTLTSIQGFDALNAAAQVIVDNLSDLGLDVEIQTVELGVWIEDWTERKFDTFTMNSWGGFVDPDLLYFNHFHQQPEGADFRRWDNEEVSELIDEGRQTVGEDERREIYLEIQRLIGEQVPLVPLYSADFVGAQRPEVENWSVHPSGHYHDLRWVSVQQ